MSINQLLNISRRSFQAFDAAMNTIGQNVANANSEGYSRRRITLESDNVSTRGLMNRPFGKTANGSGVNVAVYERLRDALLSRSGWHANGWMGASEEEHRITLALQSIFTTQTEGSLSNQLDEFWNGWSDLADNPADNGVRLALRSRAASLAGTLNRMAEDVQHLTEETERAITGGVSDVNKLLAEVAELNVAVKSGNNVGSPNLSAEDRRDVLVGKLSEFGNFRINEQPDGTYSLTLDGMSVVDGDTARTLSLDTSGASPKILIAGTPVEMKVPSEGGGRLVGWLRTLTTSLPDTRDSLNTIAETLVKEVNALHRTGFGLDGSTNVNFFNYSAGPPELGIEASTIRLSDEVQADSRAIAAAAGDTSLGVNDSDIANAILALRESKLLSGNSESIETFAINLLSGIGATAERASNLYESHASLASHVQAMARGISGVAIEEEMTLLIQYQQSFAAAARVLNAAEEMMDTLLSL
ncbi:MAG TPA: flagellar hook-associated protein FlgK [Rhodothermales bacterium]|nr:flagellar hook-associated protein FlgK [Rhodothermales bacterium]